MSHSSDAVVPLPTIFCEAPSVRSNAATAMSCEAISAEEARRLFVRDRHRKEQVHVLPGVFSQEQCCSLRDAAEAAAAAQGGLQSAQIALNLDVQSAPAAHGCLGGWTMGPRRAL